MAYLEELLPEFRKGAKIRMDCWPKEEYICLREDDIVDEDGCLRCDGLDNISNWFSNSNWELYQEPIDWQYIIDHKCLCWFCDAGNNRERLRILVYIHDSDENKGFPYEDNLGDVWKNCRPVRRDEVTFYEDKEDDITDK